MNHYDLNTRLNMQERDDEPHLPAKCDDCGRFIATGKECIQFTPDTAFTVETIEVRCPGCHEKFRSIFRRIAGCEPPG